MPEDANSPDVDTIIDSLYALEPDAFTSARDERATALRRAGDRDAAKTVKALRRPTVAAWAVNQLVRRHHDKVDELLQVTGELGDAQRDALTGGERDLRAVSERRQELLDELLTMARHVIDESGRSSSAHEDDIARTLQATTDPDLGRQLRAGRLTTALEPVPRWRAGAPVPSATTERMPSAPTVMRAVLSKRSPAASRPVMPATLPCESTHSASTVTPKRTSTPDASAASTSSVSSTVRRGA